MRLNANGTPDTGFGADSTLANSQSLFVENGAPVFLDTNVQVLDAEMTAAGNYAGATLTLSRSGGANADDVFSAGDSMSALTEGSTLSVFGTAIGTVTQNSGGVLVLTFGAGATQYLTNTALQQIRYANTNDIPPASVQINWTFSDGSLSNTDSSTTLIASTNDLPVVTLPTSLNFTEDTEGVISGISLTDVDGSAYSGTTPAINFSVATGVITFTESSTVTFGLWSDTSKTVYGTLADLNAYIAGGNVRYTPAPDATAALNLNVTVWDSAGWSQALTVPLTITPVIDQTVATAGGVLNFSEHDPYRVIDDTVTLPDDESSPLTGATVSISAGFTAGDALGFSNTASITGSYDSSTGVLTLTGSDSYANYQAALRTVSYYTSSQYPTEVSGSRTITWALSGVDVDPVTSTVNVYEYNDYPGITGIPDGPNTVSVGLPAALADVVVNDVDNPTLTLVLTA